MCIYLYPTSSGAFAARRLPLASARCSPARVALGAPGVPATLYAVPPHRGAWRGWDGRRAVAAASAAAGGSGRRSIRDRACRAAGLRAGRARLLLHAPASLSRWRRACATQSTVYGARFADACDCGRVEATLVSRQGARTGGVPHVCVQTAHASVDFESLSTLWGRAQIRENYRGPGGILVLRRVEALLLVLLGFILP